jgi:hypothetical protein
MDGDRPTLIGMPPATLGIGWMTARERRIEVNRGLGHVLREFAAISAAIARRYARGEDTAKR